VDLFTELSLFSGGGGGLLATQYLLGFKTICYVEKNKQAQKQLIARIKDGYLHNSPIWDDVRTFSGYPWRGLVDIVTAGFPCQPYSAAGKKLGASDSRNLWPDTIRIIDECKAPWVFLENVPTLLQFNYFGRILADLAKSGFDTRYECISAFDLGATHLRERLWIIANRTSGRRTIAPFIKEVQGDRRRHHANGLSWWKAEPKVLRVDDGLARGMGKQLESLGEGQVPIVVKEAFKRMTTIQNLK
jgi:DNA (cytosine-5)-methyltransferase 1